MIWDSNTILIRVSQLLDRDKMFNNNNSNMRVVMKPMILLELTTIRNILETSLDPSNQSYQIRVVLFAVNQFIKIRNKEDICFYE